MIRLIGTCLAISLFLSAQCQSEEQLVSTNLISQMLLEELDFEPTETRRVSRAYLAEQLASNELIAPPVREELEYELGLSRDLTGWRGAVARFEAECDDVFVFVITWQEEGRGQVLMVIPPNNACGPALQVILERLYGRYLSGSESIKRCVESVCVNASPFVDEEVEGCVEVIHLVDGSLPCPDNYECPEEGAGCSDLEQDFIITITIPER